MSSPAAMRLQVVSASAPFEPPAAVRNLAGDVRVFDPASGMYGWAELTVVAWEGVGSTPRRRRDDR